jgi:hypothetical protein
MDYVSQMIDEADDATKVKAIKRKTTAQNLFFMMTRGIETYDQACEAQKLMEEEYTSNRQIIDDITFKNSCEGFRKVNVQIRYEVLTGIIKEVLS